MKLFLIALALLVSLSQCKKDGAADDISPAVTITSPADGSHATGGQEITVTATIVDNASLEEVHFHVTNKANSEELVHEHYKPSGKTYDFSSKLAIQSGITYHIEVEAEDASGNATEAEIEIIGD